MLLNRKNILIFLILVGALAVVGGVYAQEIHDNCALKTIKIAKKVTKNNETMAFLTVEDTTSGIEVIVFSKLYRDFINLLSVGNVLLITGRLSYREDEECKIVCENITEAPREVKQPPVKKQENKGLYLKIKNSDCAEYKKVQNVLDVFDGTTPVYYYFTDTGKLVRHQSRLCDVNNSMLRELKRIVGDENVGIK